MKRPEGKGRIVFSSKAEAPSTNDLDEEGYDKSVVSSVFATYPLKLLIPDHASSSNCKWLYCITYGGGLVESDDIKLQIEVQKNCSTLITTQSSTKIFHCEGGGITRQSIEIQVGDNSLIAIIPDPLIPFNKANYQQSQVISMASSSNVVLLDWYSAGRVARGELWEFTRLHSSNKIIADGQTVFLDALQLSDSRHLGIKESMNQYQTLGCLLVLGSKLEQLSKNILQKYGSPKGYAAKYTKEEFFGVSPLECKVGNKMLSGCVLKFAVTNAEQAYIHLESVLKPLYPILGGDPFLNKY